MFLTENDILGIRNVLAVFTNDIAARRSIVELSMQAGMSSSKFKHCFKFYTGNPVFAFQQAHRMNVAYELVVHSRYTIDKIAALTGFKHLTHFSHAFSERFLISPYRLRKVL